MKILVADDDPIPRRMLEAILVKWEYEVVIAKDGDEAWQILQREEAPRIAILDWLMPGIDGVEVCRKLRQRTQAPYVYIILLTSKDSKEDVAEGMEAGADDYLVKPFDPHKLQVRLRAGRRIVDLQAALLDSLAELAEVRKREGEIGGRIQQTLLLGQPPRMLAGARVAALTIPSEQIDGDFYDFWLHNERCLDIIVGDVMGKGIPAALLGAGIKTYFLRALGQLLYASEGGKLPDPEKIVSLVHNDVTRRFIGLEFYATLCYARFELDRRQVVFVDCGHTKAIHYRRRKGASEALEGDNMPLGISEREIYTQVTAPFDDGDVFFFYSDGVTEAQKGPHEFFGRERLEQLVCANSELEPEALIDLVRREVILFSNAERFADDLTCVAIKIEDTGIGRPLAHATAEFASDLKELPSMRAFVRKFCYNSPSVPVTEDAIRQIELAVTEAASNVIKHAYGGQADGKIQIEVEALPGRIALRFLHEGVPFDPESAKPPVFDGTREGGFGVYFIARSMDEVHYSRDEDGKNRIDMIKKLES